MAGDTPGIWHILRVALRARSPGKMTACILGCQAIRNKAEVENEHILVLASLSSDATHIL